MKVRKVTAPTTTAKAETKGTTVKPVKATANVKETAPAEPKAKAEPKTRQASKFISVDEVNGRRMRVSEYQDYTFSVNDTRRLTDEELAADWRRQFPNAVAFTAFHVSGARRDYNKGIHSKAFPGSHNAQPWFLAADGKARTQAAPKASAAQTAPAAPKAEAKVKAATDAKAKAPKAKLAKAS